MPQAFIIIQIGNQELDEACEHAIVPAIEACGLEAKRVDKHNQGGLLKSEIITFIEQSEIIIADLTNERPNCYLEIGYSMGIDKFRNLILTVREDHNPESPSYIRGGPKIHFDLSGYDILFWNPGQFEDFRNELEKRIHRRLMILAPSTSTPMIPWDNEWITKQRERSLPGFQATQNRGFMEIRFALNHPKPYKSQQELAEAARSSTIHTFGWPIGVYMTKEEFRPRPQANGIVAEIRGDDRSMYDFWAFKRNGDFYLLKTIFEDERDQAKLFFDTRIIRVTETLLYCVRLYSRLKIEPTTMVNVAIKHGGLKGRILGAANALRFIHTGAPTAEEEVESESSVSLNKLEADLVDFVKQITASIFILFDFFEIPDSVYEEIVNNYVKGRTS